MRRAGMLVRAFVVLIAMTAPALCQTGQSAKSAAATSVTASSGRPSTFQIRQHILAQQRAVILRELNQVQRCITDSTRLQSLRDPQGNVNQVPKIDLVNCARRLRQLQDQVAALTRQSTALGQDASAQAARLQQALQRQQQRLRLLGRSAM
jgi:hypothetical protein